MGSKVGTLKSVRKNKWSNVLYWTVFYTYVFIVSTKYFVYEDGIVSFDFSMTALYQHIALLGSIIIGFLIFRRRTYRIPKIVMSGLSLLLILFGAIFNEVRSNLIYLIFLSVLLGQLADISLLTYIYEMNNTERLYAIVFCHLLSAAVAAFSIKYGRMTAQFWWLVFALAFIALVACLFEKKDTEWEIAFTEEFHNKLYVPLILACIGGVVAVCSSMLIMEKLAVNIPQSRWFFYAGAGIGAAIYFLQYRFAPKPATVTLVTGFGFAVIGIFLYVVDLGQAASFSSAFFAGATFNICMMNLYYILCNIIKKYKDSNMFRIAPIVSNFAGIAIAVIATMAFFYASDKLIKIGLSMCLVGDVLVLATSVFWDKGVARTAKQEEYMSYDITVTKEQIYEAVKLTDKEIEVCELLLLDMSLKDIAAKLFITVNTAKTHRAAIYKKMQVSSKEELSSKLKIGV